MPNKPSAKKALRQDEKKKVRNLRIKRGVVLAIKKSRKAIEAKTADAESVVKEALKLLDLAAQKGVIKKNNASRRKSRLASSFNKSKSKA